jgi:hypothetical protein
MNEHFGSFELFMTNGSDMMIVATKGSRLPEPDWSVFSRPTLARDLCAALPLTPQVLEATRVASRTALAPILDKWTHPNSDFFPLLDLAAERTRFLLRSATGFTQLTSSRFDLLAPLFGHRIPPSQEPRAAVASTPRLVALARGALVRDWPGLALDDSTSESLKEAVFQSEQWLDQLETGSVPTDWRIWLVHFKQVEEIRAGGTAGFAEERFYLKVDDFLDRNQAPAEARRVVAYYHGMARWDFEAVSAAADSLLLDGMADSGWITPEDLLEGGVVAKLRIGDTEGAKRLLESLRPRGNLGPASLRLQLLDSYVRAAETVAR